MVVFEARNLSVLSKADVMIFENFSFSIDKGQIWMLHGPNGIGKSSFYEALIGIHEIKGGEIILKSKILNKMTPANRVRSGLKYVPQSNALFFDATVIDNLKMIADLLVPYAKRKEAVAKAIELFNLETLLKRKCTELSGGQQRRVELSKIIIGDCDLIIMDEPFAAIDLDTIEKISKVILQIKQEGKSFIITDHNVSAVEKISDFLISLEKNSAKIIKLKDLG
jgi:ABC-type multidrug transport system ATPase subunit